MPMKPFLLRLTTTRAILVAWDGLWVERVASKEETNVRQMHRITG